MNVHLKKLKFKLYLISGAVLLAVGFAFWLFSYSFVSIKVSPRDAEVFIDGEKLEINIFGVGKKRLNLGSHLVEIEKDGYINNIQNTSFRRGLTSRLNITLKEKPKPLEVSKNGKFLTKQDNTNDFYYLDSDNSTLYKTNIGLNKNNEVSITGYAITSSLSGIKEIVWSPKKDLALFKKDDGVYLFDFKKYDFVNQTETPWGSNVGDIAWSPDNSKIAYFYSPPDGERSLIFTNLDNSSPERVLNMNEVNVEDPLLRWAPDSEWLLIIPQNNSKIKTIFLFNAFSRQIEELTKATGKVDARFSPDAQTILYSSQDEKGGVTLKTITLDRTVNSDLNLSSPVRNIFWSEKTPNIVSGFYDEKKQLNLLSNFNLDYNQPDKYSLFLPGVDEIKAVVATNDDNILVYETDEGIYALKID